MSAQIINGTEMARQIRQELKQEIAELKEKYNLIPGLAKKAGLQIGTTRAIQVDRYMLTTDPNIFACGDCAEKVSFFNGQPSAVMLASIAGAEGRIAGADVFNTCCRNCDEIGVFSTIIGERAFACVGLTASPMVYQLVNAAELAVKALK